jgi:hypothetical protein
MTTDWHIDPDELKRETIARLNEIKAQQEKYRQRRERRRRLNRLSFGLLGR